jgi:hypothetical protein
MGQPIPHRSSSLTRLGLSHPIPWCSLVCCYLLRGQVVVESREAEAGEDDECFRVGQSVS